MNPEYTYRWGFVWHVAEKDRYKVWTYVYRWGFVWRVLRSNDDPRTIPGWLNYNFYDKSFVEDLKTQTPFSSWIGYNSFSEFAQDAEIR